MPTYVYKFVETGETIEVQQSFSDPTLTEVVNPRTGVAMAVKKVFQPVGVTFKGSGFYKTDSRSGAGKRTSPGADTASSDTTSSDTASTDAPSTTATTSDTASTATTTATPAPSTTTSGTPSTAASPPSTGG